MSTFSSLNAATTALWAQRRALDVTGQNIANVNTEGYSRQRVDLQAIGGSVVPAFFSTSNGIGGGRQRRRGHRGSGTPSSRAAATPSTPTVPG